MKLFEVDIICAEISSMDIRHLRTFEAILRHGSFGGAARALRLAQPTVTLHIQELEQELGLPLFDRRGRRRHRTVAGDLLAERALPILDALDAMTRSMAELADGRAGLLQIGSIEPAASQRVMPLLARLRRNRPALRVRMEVAGTSGVSRGVADGHLDLGVCSAPPAELSLRFEPLFSEEMALLVPRRHPLARAKSLRARDLNGEPMLLTDQGCAYRRAIEAALQQRGVRPQWTLESGSAASLREAVRLGWGLAFMPRLAASPAPPGAIVRSLRDLTISLPVGVVTRHASPPPTPALAVLLEALRTELGAHGRRSSRRSGPKAPARAAVATG
jgi:DNA-binding transcriptional LysR family regulator